MRKIRNLLIIINFRSKLLNTFLKMKKKFSLKRNKKKKLLRVRKHKCFVAKFLVRLRVTIER